ncbi:MAG: type II CAAX prenyl endopeptidase Rce1 family protein [Promethearchaeota archaeon]
MIKLKKSKIFIIPILSIFFFITSLFLFEFKWWLPREQLDFIPVFLLILTFIIFEIFALLINLKILKSSITLLKEQLVVKSLQEKNILIMCVVFPLTMLFEEVLFRLYFFTFVFTHFGFFMAFVLGTLVFSFYHIHIWFQFQNKRVLISFILISALLGMLLNITLLNLGLIACIFVHGILVLGLFYDIHLRINHNYQNLY